MIRTVIRSAAATVALAAAASYDAPDGDGRVTFVLKEGERPRCTADGRVTCRFEFDPRRGQEVFIVDGNR